MNALQLLVGYLLTLAPQLGQQLSSYVATHSNPYMAAFVTVVGAVMLHTAKPPEK